MIIDASDRFSRNKDVEETGAEKAIRRVGKSASDNLFSDMHSKIDKVSRQIFADNFNKLLEKYGVRYPRYFESLYDEVAESYESFRTTFGSMKNPNSRYIPSGKIYWKNYSKLLIKRLRKDNINLTEDYVAHKLTMGTKYHPTQNCSTEIDQVVRNYQTLALEFDTKHGLMETYREISNCVVDRSIEDIRRKIEPSYDDNIHFSGIDIIHSDLCEYFNEDYLEQRRFSAARFFDLKEGELLEVVAALRELSEGYDEGEEGSAHENDWLYFRRAEEELKSYLLKIDRGVCHIEEPWWGELEYHPHCLLGVHFDRSQYLPERGRAIEQHLMRTLVEQSTKGGIGDPKEILFDASSAEVGRFPEIGYTYLVLFPSHDLSRLVPQILILEDECTSLVPLSVDVMSCRGNTFINTTFPHAVGSENNSLLELLLDTERILARLKATACNVRQHPVLLSKQCSQQKFQAAVTILRDPFEDE